AGESARTGKSANARGKILAAGTRIGWHGLSRMRHENSCTRRNSRVRRDLLTPRNSLSNPVTRGSAPARRLPVNPLAPLVFRVPANVAAAAGPNRPAAPVTPAGGPLPGPRYRRTASTLAR